MGSGKAVGVRVGAVGGSVAAVVGSVVGVDTSAISFVVTVGGGVETAVCVQATKKIKLNKRKEAGLNNFD